MIEEIKKEISKIRIEFKQEIKDKEFGCYDFEGMVFNILDKYNNQQTLVTLKDFENVSNKLIDYQSAFNELLKDMYNKNDVMVLGRLKDLKQKYNLGGE